MVWISPISSTFFSESLFFRLSPYSPIRKPISETECLTKFWMWAGTRWQQRHKHLLSCSPTAIFTTQFSVPTGLLPAVTALSGPISGFHHLLKLLCFPVKLTKTSASFFPYLHYIYSLLLKDGRLAPGARFQGGSLSCGM